MNLEKLLTWIIGVVIAFSAAGKLDLLQIWIWKAQAKVIYESQSAKWGSPRFFPMADNLGKGSEVTNR